MRVVSSLLSYFPFSTYKAPHILFGLRQSALMCSQLPRVFMQSLHYFHANPTSAIDVSLRLGLSYKFSEVPLVHVKALEVLFSRLEIKKPRLLNFFILQIIQLFFFGVPPPFFAFFNALSIVLAVSPSHLLFQRYHITRTCCHILNILSPSVLLCPRMLALLQIRALCAVCIHNTTCCRKAAEVSALQL